MYIIIEYATCIGLTLGVSTLLFAACAAFLVIQEGTLRLGGIIRVVLQRRGEPALKPAG